MKHLTVLAALLVLSACAGPSSQDFSNASFLSKAPTEDGAYRIHVAATSCGNGAHFQEKNRIASFTSFISGGHAEGPVASNGSFDIKTPVIGTFGTTRMQVNADGTGVFEVDNPYHGCTAKILGIVRDQ